jgi:hypothetical protein
MRGPEIISGLNSGLTLQDRNYFESISITNHYKESHRSYSEPHKVALSFHVTHRTSPPGG